MFTLCYNDYSYLKGGVMLLIFAGVALSVLGPPPDVVSQMLQRIRNDTAASRTLTYIQERTEYEIRNDGDRLKSLESRTVRGTGSGFLNVLTLRNGKATGKTKEEPLETAMILLTTKYDFVAVAAAVVVVDGYDCWQVQFTPLDGLEDGSDDDAILNHIQGIAFVDVHNHLIRAIHATLSKPFRHGFLGAARITAVTLDTRQIEWDEKKRVGIQTTSVIRLQFTVIGDTYLRIEYLNTNHRWQP